MHRRELAIGGAVLIAAVALAGCGGSEDSTSPAQTAPGVDNNQPIHLDDSGPNGSSSGDSGSNDAGSNGGSGSNGPAYTHTPAYTDSKAVCAVSGVDKVRNVYGGGGTAVSVAQAYAEEGYQLAFQGAAMAGCLAGFEK